MSILKRNIAKKVYDTIYDKRYHVAFDMGKYKHIAITFHASKGLEFEQVVVFAEDYRLNDMESIYNHYVAATRAKSKLIIVRTSESNANQFVKNLTDILKESQLKIGNLVSDGNRL